MVIIYMQRTVQIKIRVLYMKVNGCVKNTICTAKSAEGKILGSCNSRLFHMYILMKRDIGGKLFFFCQIQGFILHVPRVNKDEVMKVYCIEMVVSPRRRML